jgi:ATP-dependent DNA helicase RecG
MTITLTTSVKELKGVGPTKASALARLGIKTVDDLLHHYPTGYTFAPPVTTVAARQEHQTITGVGTVTMTEYMSFGSFPRFTVMFTDELSNTDCRVTWFGRAYLRETIFKGSRLMVSGRISHDGFSNPTFKVLKPDETPNPANLNEVTYPVTSGITSKDIGRLVQQCCNSLWLGLPGNLFELGHIHHPADRTEADRARNLLKYDELFYMQLGLAVRQARRESVPPNVQCVCGRRAGTPIGDMIVSYFPFEFTDDQNQATADIVRDLYRSRAMNRLLQGDVGCGKTSVAAYAAIVTAFNGAQTAILCPTEILARQHYETIRGYFEEAGVTCALSVGHTARFYLMGYTAPDIVVGTTALLSEGVTFRNLGLVIIDEQHKFGVEQRAALRRHGNPHCLVMTATPIPRTIAMTVFGDLDISTIRSMPPGRRPVKTKWVCTLLEQMEHKRTAPCVKDILDRELAAGHQVYVVCPRIEALDDEMRAVEEVAEEYAQLFPGYQVGEIYGRMHPDVKTETMDDWMLGETRILVSTTVVEVGVDNPNATVMVIEGAERFGLAQLHQLRGRVGRNKVQSYCFLLSDTDATEARSRLRIMEKTNDGFEIAEHDLKMRGPGDLLSTRQHGLPDLKIADLVKDYDLMLEARAEARELVAAGPLPASVRTELEKRFGGDLLLGDTA